MVESGAHKKVMVCGADANTRMTDYTDRTTCVLFGDGGGAVLLEPCAEGEIGFIDYWHEIDGSGAAALNMPGGGSLNPSSHETVDKKMHYIHQDGQAVYKFAVRKMLEATSKVLERNGVTGADLGCFIPHQANMRIITATADRLGMDRSRVIINIEKYGNTSAGTIPLAMGTALEEGKLKKGDLVLLAAAGAGFTIGGGAAEVGDLKDSEQWTVNSEQLRDSKLTGRFLRGSAFLRLCRRFAIQERRRCIPAVTPAWAAMRKKTFMASRHSSSRT